MEIAVFSDIHGNYEAFKQCVDLVLGRGIRTFIFLGDYLGEFPYPQKTMGLLYALKEAYTCFFVKGNKEDYWIDRKYNPACEWKDGDLTVGAMEYCYAHQTDRDISFFPKPPAFPGNHLSRRPRPVGLPRFAKQEQRKNAPRR